MGKPAARVGDMHVCPMVTPGTPPIPHVGGPVLPPGAPTVLIGGMPAATMGDMCTCTGPPDSIVVGSTGVLIGGKPAARMGDTTAHGGAITVGLPTVLIGETAGGGGSGGSTGGSTGQGSAGTLSDIAQFNAPPQSQTLKEASKDGAPFCEICSNQEGE